MSSKDPHSSDEQLDFLKQRVAAFGLVAGLVGAAFLGYRVIVVLASGRLDILVQPGFYMHAAATVVFLAVWWICRRGQGERLFVRATESLGLVVGSGCYMLMASSIPHFERPDLIMLLALSIMLFARAVYVPSSSLRTGILGGVVGIPLLIVTSVIYQRPSPWMTLASQTAAYDVGVAITLSTAVWWTLIVLVCAGASHIIFGLRREVANIRRLGQYTLDRKLGEGGMGIVYNARHAMLRRPTAIKLLPPEKAGEKRIARFAREVQLTARLSHPHTVTIFDYGRTPDGVFYYAMELLEGATLSEVVKVDGRQDPRRVVAVLRACAGALAEAHSVGLIHRDIKPANIMLARRGGQNDFAKVLDFGLVKEIETSGADPAVSRAGVVTGTPQYMAPEAISTPEAIDGRADLYALGAVGYFLLTGEHVFEGTNIVEICSKHLHEQPIAPAERVGESVHPELETIVMRCLEKKPEHRYQSARELLEALDALDVRWPVQEADAWWRAHGQRLAEMREGGTTLVSEKTIGMDLGRRSRGRSRSERHHRDSVESAS